MKIIDTTKSLITVWVFFFFSLIFEIILSLFLRYKDGSLMTGTVGMKEELWYFYQVVVFVIFVVALYKLNTSLTLVKRFLFIIVNFGIAFLLYAVIILFYVVGTRVDSM